jgi:hypothetical protein
VRRERNCSLRSALVAAAGFNEAGEVASIDEVAEGDKLVRGSHSRK